uniref:Actin interacting protein 3-like C-terminal domain-containing protein n=1 Tax=Amphiprion ocellaris TaxID=80972 RepID=A0AAQ5ZTX3_AMPOC
MNINSTYILTRCSCVSSEQTKSNLKVTSPEDAERVSRRQASPNGTASSRGDSKGGRTVPRRHTLGGARSSREILAMQPSDMDKKREAFLEHLKQKYPHHASAIMGHQERLREQSRSPKHGPSPQPSVGDQVDHLSLASLESLDAMSETDAPTTFTRGSRVRASLPVVRSTNQTKDRSLGVLYLQYGDETKQIRMPNEITSIDTIRALFVSAFPQQLTMKMLESPSVAVYVKDDMRNMYYELADVRNITDHSCLKVYHKDPAQAFSHGARPANGDARMHNEMAHASRDGQHPLRHPPMGPPAHHPMQGALPPTPHSMPPSPSRIPFGPRQGSIPGNATIPRDRLSNANPPARSISPCPSAILERRDVKPDEDVGGKSHSLARGNEGLYADPYLLQEGRMTMAAGHGPHPNPGLEGPEHGLGGFHRASIRSTGSYSGPSPTDTMDHPSLYRQKSRNSQLPTLGSKTPPPSPHRMTEVRMIDIHSGPPHGVPPHGRSSPVRQSFRKEEVAGTKPRNNMGSPVVTDIQGHIQGPIPAASGSPVLAPKSNAAPSEKSSVPLKVNLLQFRKNVSDLRMQLHQMRQLQLQNQEALRVQLKRAEQEISIKLAEAMRRLEDPVQRQRALVEEDRHKYLGLEERVLAQLSELEQFVGSLQKDSATTQRVVTLKDVEEGAVTLRKVGESLAGLKGEFPALQTRMRAVLRVEVEAVKFLKEEPHKLDSMLKRVKSLTDTLSSLRRSATEFSQKGPDPSTAVSVDNSPAAAAAEAPLEPQTSTIRSEVMPSSPVVIHHVQSSPVHMQQSQQSAALTAQPTAASDPPSPARQKKTQGNPVNNGNGTANQDLVIEELQNSQDKSKNRAMSIEAAEKEWEERRQNMGHYDGKEFEKILQEAQANMMKGIPSLEKPAKPALERPSKTAIRPAAPDSLTRQGSDKASKSPPPPPPRKTYPSSSSGMTTTRSGEVVYTNRKESVAAQVRQWEQKQHKHKLQFWRFAVKEAPKRLVPPPKKTSSKQSEPPKANAEDSDDGASLCPDQPGEEAPPPPDNVAFMITNTKVQALSCGEYQELVNAKKGSVQTVTVGNAANRGNTPVDPSVPQDNGFNKKPVIIIFDEPMDIRSAYKRLSTIFECEEELDRMLAEERIDEESEESDSEKSSGLSVKAGETTVVDGKKVTHSQGTADHASLSSSSSSSISELTDSGVNQESNGDAKQDGKKKFKFKFPKKQLAALTQAIRTGTKSGKKTLQVVVYEDEEESDGTIRQHKEAKRFEIARSKSLAETPKGTGTTVLKKQNSDTLCRTDEIRKNTYKTLDSLEQTIKQLETTISEMGPRSPEEPVGPEEAEAGNGKNSEGVGLKRSSSLPTSRGVASPTSRMPVPLSAKSRQSPGTTDKAGKQQKLQDAQRQFRQANGSAKRVGGDHKTTSPTVPISKIPAFYPSSTKGSSQCAPNSDATNPINPSSSSSSSSSSVTKSSTLSSRSGSLPSSHIPSLSNGSLKLPSQHTGKALSFSSQTPNGRVHSSSSSSSFSSSSSSCSSSSPSPLSPTPLGPGGKSIRTIHTPSFTSYRSHNGSNGKSCIPTATAAKDTT